jgi:hypothetical protein
MSNCQICLSPDSFADIQLMQCGCTFHELCFKSVCFEQFIKDQKYYNCACEQRYTHDVNHSLIPLLKLDPVMGFEVMTEIQQFASKRIHEVAINMYSPRIGKNCIKIG